MRYVYTKEYDLALKGRQCCHCQGSMGSRTCWPEVYEVEKFNPKSASFFFLSWCLPWEIREKEMKPHQFLRFSSGTTVTIRDSTEWMHSEMKPCLFSFLSHSYAACTDPREYHSVSHFCTLTKACVCPTLPSCSYGVHLSGPDVLPPCEAYLSQACLPVHLQHTLWNPIMWLFSAKNTLVSQRHRAMSEDCWVVTAS